MRSKRVIKLYVALYGGGANNKDDLHWIAAGSYQELQELSKGQAVLGRRRIIGSYIVDVTLPVGYRFNEAVGIFYIPEYVKRDINSNV